MMNDKTNDLLKVTLVDRQPQRPPLSLLYFDIRLYNPAGVARYYLLSDKLSATAEPGDYSIDVAYVYELSGQGRALVVHFAGSSGFFALLLLAGAQIELRNLPLEFWGEVPDQVTITVIIGEDLKIAGQAAEDWLDINPGSGLNAAVDAGALSDQLAVIKSKSVPAKDRAAVSLAAAEELRLLVSTLV